MSTKEMQKNEQGWFCGGCEKQVFDFSQTNKQNINSLIENNAGEICGLIPQKKLIPVIHLPFGFSKVRWLISLAGLLAFIVTSCKSKKVLGGIKTCGNHKYYVCTHMDARTMTYAHQPNINDSAYSRIIKNCIDSLNIIKD